MRGAAPVLLLLASAALAQARVAQGAEALPGLGLYRAVGAALSQRRDPGAALALLDQAKPRSEQDPGLLYLKALALARAHRGAEALSLASRLEELDPGFHAATDPQFAALRPAPRPSHPVGSLRVVARLDLPQLFPEGLAVDPRNGRTFLSSLRHGGILVLESGGRPRWFLKPGPAGPWRTLGLKVDARRGLLWVASQGAARRASPGAGAAERAALFAVDLDSGRVRRRILLRGGGRHLLNDLAIAADGTVFVTDSEAGTVLRLAPGGTALTPILPAGTLEYPNGLVSTRDGKGLLVAGGGPGLHRLDLETGRVREVELPPGMHLQGIDGLLRAGSRLVAVQNGLPPGRVALLELDEGESELRSLKVLAAGQEELEGIPTTGDLHGGAFRFIANSQIPLLQRKGKGPRPLPFVIAEVDLPPAAADR